MNDVCYYCRAINAKSTDVTYTDRVIIVRAAALGRVALGKS